MRTRRYYCSACDREVEVVVSEDGTPLDTAIQGAPVCLDHGDRCTGGLCPLFELPTEAMKQAAAQFRKVH
jgi:hypothetical protein